MKINTICSAGMLPAMLLTITGGKSDARIRDNGQEEKPDILIIHCDQLAAWTLGCYGGTEITSCRLPNGVLINLRAGKMAYPDGSKFYFGMETHNSLTVKGGVRLITDKDFKVQNYILNGKSVNIAKNESAKFPNSHGFALDKHGYLQSEEFLSGGGQVVKMSFQKGGEVPQIRFSDGTVLRLSPEKPVLSHAGIELSYRSRKAFAESYVDGGNGGHGNSGGNGGIFPPGGGRGGR